MIIKEQDGKAVYSDGSEIESTMLEIAEKYPEDLSEDIISSDSSYTINNTFSSVRKNILNWYPFRENADVLEIGAGMGSITGLLCDRCKSVTSVEMNKARADVIRARYPKRENLTVISENVNDWNTDKRFDYVVFIGVLEYAELFSDSASPFVDFLKNAKRFLKPDGILLFAIENRFGIKYWMGSSEDHLQKPFVGINGYGKDKSPRTFSKAELEELLEKAGFKNRRIYSVLPDYKFPELIFSEEYKPDYRNLQKLHFTYSKNSLLYGNEKNLYKDIINNNVFTFFANSFLVEAGAADLDEKHIRFVSAKSEVHKQYRVSTIIDSENNVFKAPMTQNAKKHIDTIMKNTEQLKDRGIFMIPVKLENDCIVSPEYDGVISQEIFASALKNNDRNLLFKLVDCLKENLLKSSDTLDKCKDNYIVKNKIADEDLDYGIILKDAYVDMTFYNAFWVNDSLLFFDQEWCFKDMPLNFCLYYSIKSAYTKANVKTQISLDEIYEYLKIDKDFYKIYDKTEDSIWSGILYRQTDFYGADGYCNRYADELTIEHKFSEIKTENENKISELKRENDNKISEYENRISQIQSENQRKMAEQEEAARAKEENLRAEMNSLENMKNENIRSLEQMIRSKDGHIERLLAVEREYNLEKTSKVYRIAMILRNTSIFMFPINSKRRFFFGLFTRCILHPKKIPYMLSGERVKKFKNDVKKDGFSAAINNYRLDEQYAAVSKNEPLQIELTEIAKKPDALSFEDYEVLNFKEWENPQVSIIIPVYNQFNYTWHCLKSILDNTEGCTYEIIIANDCSTDLTTRINELVKGIKVINNKENLKFLLNCNNAAKYAKGDYILFLNNDTQVQKNWLLPLVSLMENDETIGITGSKLLYPDGFLQEAGGILWNDGSAWNYGNRQHPDEPEFNYVHEVDYISGAALMIRTKLWEEIGGYDTHFVPAYCEDSDLAFEVRKHGYKVVYQPKSEVVHFEGVSNGTDLNSGLKKYQVENQKKFREKWAAVLEAEHFENGREVFVARDKSRHKKHILFIDHYVPQYDKDAGSKTTFMYLKMLVQKGYSITFLGDNFYKHEPYTETLQQMGVMVLYGPRYAASWKEWLLENISYFDIFYLNRPHITIKYIDIIKEHCRGKVIYYGHDLHFLRLKREYELNGNKMLLEESDRLKKQEFYIMNKADISYYPSAVECAEIAKIAPHIKTKAITAYVYERLWEGKYDGNDREGILFVGGFSHGPNLDAVMWFIEKIYPDVYSKTNANFYIVGSNAPSELMEIKQNGVIMKGFVSEEELISLYSSCRLAVVPLRYGAGVKGKVVEALYYGIPVVTTSVGAEGIGGIEDLAVVCDGEENMAAEIINIYNDLDRLKSMSDKSKVYVKNNFGTEAVWNVIKEDFS